jgi:hypothetical protein
VEPPDDRLRSLIARAAATCATATWTQRGLDDVILLT